MRAFGGYTLQDCLDLTLPDMAAHLTKLCPTLAEPEWFVESVRSTKDYKARLIALKAYTHQG